MKVNFQIYLDDATSCVRKEEKMSKITDQIDRIFKKYGQVCFFSGGALKDEIKEAQQSLGVLFPEDYRQFLACYGAGSFGGCEIYGILPAADTPGIPDGIWATRYLRQKYQLPEAYIAVAFDGYGGYFCIDTGSRGKDGLCPVVLWNMGKEEAAMDGDGGGQEKSQPAETVSESFESFLLSWLKEEIDLMV